MMFRLDKFLARVLLIIPLILLSIFAVPTKPAYAATFGYTSIGGSTSALSADTKRFTKFTSPSNIESVDSINVYANRTTTGTGFAIRGAIYTDSSGAPGTLVTNSDIEINANITRNAPGWYSVNYSTKPTLSPNTVYWIGVQAAKASVTYFTTGSANQTYTKTDTYTGGLDASWGAVGTPTTEQHSFYITYTVNNITVGSTGTQATSMLIPSTGQYVGGAFTMVRSAGSTNVSSIKIAETGSVNAQTNLTNVKLYYETAGTCTYDGTETQYGITGSFDASQTSTFTGSASIGTSQVCFYVVLDVGSGASGSQTLDIQITNPSTDVVPTIGTVSPGTAVAISGSTTLNTPVVSISITTDGTVAYGVIANNTSKSTLVAELNDTQTILNDGNLAVDLNIKTTNATGGTQWSLGASSASDTFVHEFSSNAGSNWTKFTTAGSYQSLTTNLLVSSSKNLDLRITTPTSVTDFVQKSISITVQAVQH